MQNLKLVFIASVLYWKYPFWVSLVQKMKISVLAEIWPNSNMKNSMVMFTLSVFERNYPFYGKFVSKNQIC